MACDAAPAPTRPAATATDARSAPAPEKDAGVELGRCSEPSLRAELYGYCEAGVSSGPPGMVVLPWKRSPGTRPPAAVEILVTRDGQINVDGTVTSAATFAAVWRRHVEDRPGSNVTWLLAIAADVDVARVAAIMEALMAAGQSRGHLVFTVPGAANPAGPRDAARLAELHAKIDRPDLGEKAMLLAQEMQSSKITTCPALMRVFGAIAEATPETKCQLLARGVAESFPACGCENADEILTLLYAVMADTQPPARRGAWIPVTLRQSAPPTPATTGTTWAHFIATLDAAALSALRIEVSPHE